MTALDARPAPGSHTATLDSTTTTVTVHAWCGRAVCAVGAGLTRRTAPAALARHGWTLHQDWRLTSPPDGFACTAAPTTTP